MLKTSSKLQGASEHLKVGTEEMTVLFFYSRILIK